MAPAAEKRRFRYRWLAAEIARQIDAGVFPPGGKLPSIRRLHRRTGLSIATVYQAFLELEAAGKVEARARSGFYVRPVGLERLKAPLFPRHAATPQRVSLAPAVNAVTAAVSDPRVVPFGNSGIDPAHVPVAALARIVKSLNRREMRQMLSTSPSEGLFALRRQIAARSLGVLPAIAPEEIVVTNGCMEAVALALLAVTRPGDAVAIESPTNFGFLQLLRELGLLVVEIATDPEHGVDLAALETSLARHRVRAGLFMPNFHNPLGALMPAEQKAALARLCAERRITVIEDDISGELHFGAERPPPLAAFDREGRVIYCSSFSKTIAPGLRLGWCLPGRRHLEKIRRLKAGTTIATSTLEQAVVARYLASGAYERHLRLLRGALAGQMVRTALEIQRRFPAGTRLALPRGGTLLWVQLPAAVDALAVYREAFARGISVVPGPICSNARRFRSCIQVSFAAPFGPRIREAVATLGGIVAGLAAARPPPRAAP